MVTNRVMLTALESFLSSAAAFMTSRPRSEVHGGELTVDSLGKLSQLGLRLHGLYSSQVAAWRQPQEARYLQQQK
jgi:hypothetical protein